jgi:hypothetical protein
MTDQNLLRDLQRSAFWIQIVGLGCTTAGVDNSLEPEPR